MEHLFDPSKPYLAARGCLLCEVEQGWFRPSFDTLPDRPPQLKGTALYYTALCGFGELAQRLVVARGEDVNAKCGRHGNPLHAASYEGQLDAVRVLLDHGANLNITKVNTKRTPLFSAYFGRNLEVMRLLLEHGADVDVQDGFFGPLMEDASYFGNTEVVQLLLQHKADVNVRDVGNRTFLFWPSLYGHPEVVQLLLEHGADVNAQSIVNSTPLV